MKRTLLLISVSILFLLHSCSDNVEPFVIYDIEDDFKITLHEKLNESNRELTIEITSIASFDCENTIISAEFQNSNGELDLFINDLKVPAGCEEGDYVAIKKINLGAYGVGEYNLTISIRDAIFNHATLVVTEDTYELIFEDTPSGIVVPEPELIKIPENTIWGRIEFNQENAAFLSDALHSELMAANYSSHILNIGNYTNFTYNSEGAFIWDNPSEYDHQITVVYQYNGNNIEELSNIISNFNNMYSGTYNFDIDMFTYQGEEY